MVTIVLSRRPKPANEKIQDDPLNDVIVHSLPIGRWFATFLVLVVIFVLFNDFLVNPNVHWRVVGRFILDHGIVEGAKTTIVLTILTMVIGSMLGIVIALMRLSTNPLLTNSGLVYVWLFRSTPLLVQLIFWYNIALFLPRLNLGVPYGPVFLSVETNAVITPFIAAVVAFSLNEAAYMAEIFRAGVTSVVKGQTEAALGLGMSKSLTFRKVIFPQALRVIIPPAGNETIHVLKGTSLVFAISIGDLLTSAQTIYSANFEVIALLIVVTIWYLLLASLIMMGQALLERSLRQTSWTPKAAGRMATVLTR